MKSGRGSPGWVRVDRWPGLTVLLGARGAGRGDAGVDLLKECLDLLVQMATPEGGGRKQPCRTGGKNRMLQVDASLSLPLPKHGGKMTVFGITGRDILLSLEKQSWYPFSNFLVNPAKGAHYYPLFQCKPTSTFWGFSLWYRQECFLNWVALYIPSLGVGGNLPAGLRIPLVSVKSVVLQGQDHPIQDQDLM